MKKTYYYEEPYTISELIEILGKIRCEFGDCPVDCIDAREVDEDYGVHVYEEDDEFSVGIKL